MSNALAKMGSGIWAEISGDIDSFFCLLERVLAGRKDVPVNKVEHGFGLDAFILNVRFEGDIDSRVDFALGENTALDVQIVEFNVFIGLNSGLIVGQTSASGFLDPILAIAISVKNYSVVRSKGFDSDLLNSESRIDSFVNNESFCGLAHLPKRKANRGVHGSTRHA